MDKATSTTPSSPPKPAKVRTAAEALVTAIAVAGALVLLNVLSCGTHARVDLTERGIYSLSPASQILVHKLPEKLTIKGYFGNVPAEYSDRQAYVENLLAEYADASGGKVEYEKFDVDASENEKAKERQKELAGEGIDRLMLFSFKNDKREQVPAYFHVKFSYLDKNEVWTAQSGGFTLEGLEYEFSSRIQRLTAGQKKKVGVTTGFGEPEQIQGLSAAGVEAGRSGTRVGLGDLYDVQPVNWNTTPKDIDNVDVLIVNGPTQKVSDAAIYYLDQFVMQGKPVIVLARGMSWKPGGNEQQMPMAAEGEQPYIGQPNDSGLDELLAHWGFVVGKDVILDARASVPGAVPLGQGQPLETNVLFPLARVEDGDIGGVLEGMEALVLPYASTVKLTGRLDGKHEGFDVHKLLSTSPASFTKSELMVLTRQTRLSVPKDAHGNYVTAWAVDGTWPSFFAGKPKPAGVTAPAPAADADKKDGADATGDKKDDKAGDKAGEPIAQSPPHTRIIVMGGTGFAEDQTLAIMRFVGNPIFLNGFVAAHAMVDWLVQDTNLVAVRSKRVLRPLTEEKDEGQRMWLKYGNVAGVPIVFVLFGIVYWRVRESRRRRVKL